MRKPAILFVALGLAVFVATALVAVPANKAPEKATIDDCVVKKSAVEFPHGTHSKRFECKTCHHTQPELKATDAVEVKTCGTCHVKPEKAGLPKCSEMGSKTNPFHSLCVDCHKQELAKQPQIKAPTKCDECHPKT